MIPKSSDQQLESATKFVYKQRSETIGKIIGALAKAQGEIKSPKKNRTAKIPMKSGGTYSYDYSDYVAIIEAVTPSLSKYGIAHYVTLGVNDQGDYLECFLAHESGEWISSIYQLPTDADPKLRASQITYGRRYTLQALVGISGDDDTDDAPEGEYTSKKPALKPATKSNNSPAVNPIKPTDLKPVKSEFIYPVESKLAGLSPSNVPTADLQSYLDGLVDSMFKKGIVLAELGPIQKQVYLETEKELSKRKTVDSGIDGENNFGNFNG